MRRCRRVAKVYAQLEQQPGDQVCNKLVREKSEKNGSGRCYEAEASVWPREPCTGTKRV